MTAALRTLLAVAALALGGCGGTMLDRAPAQPPALPIAFELAPGGEIALPRGDALRYVALASDSRCPVEVQCIHAGEAVLQFELVTAGRTHAFELSTAAPRDAAASGAYRVTLLEVSRRSPHDAHVSVSLAD